MTFRWLRPACILSVPLLSACDADRPLAPRASARDLSAAAGAPVPVALTHADGRFTIDTRAGLVFQVNDANCDVVSLRYQGLELQDQSKFSHISSGLGSTNTQVAATTSDDGTTATVTCTTPTLTHYYVARGNTSAIFMATYITAEPSVGELRYIARLDHTRVPNGNPFAEINGGTAIEGSDVFLVGGETRSKFYNDPPAIDNLVHGVTGPGVGVYMIMGNRESSSGGPFFRDINNQGTAQQELYNYMNSGHTQTEAFRMGLHGPYALVFTSGPAPSPDLDMSWMGGLGLTGWVSDRGRVTGRVSGVRGASPTAPGGVDFVVGWANARAQYWARVDRAGGDFTSPPMIPGTYTETLYKKELAVDTSTVTVDAGGTVTEHLTYVDPPTPVLFRIGEFDGTPDGFRNADLIAYMHPSDARMKPWGPLTYVVGESALGDFPMAQFQRAANDPTTIQFTLGPGEVRPHTLRVGITLAFAGARPVVTVNPGTPQEWTSPIPPATNRVQPNSRGVTRGTYRGNNMEFTYDIPATAFVGGTNTIVIHSASGSSGTGFLSPSFVYDAVQLDR